MPSLDQNLAVWGETYDWSLRGDEWSRVAFLHHSNLGAYAPENLALQLDRAA